MNNNNTAGQTAIQKFDYNGSPISFANGDSVMVNATQMAKKFGKRPIDWLNLPSTKEFLNELTEVRKSNFGEIQLVTTKRGGTDLTMQGTWMHEDVAIEFARWLSPKFAIWCNDRIKELAKDGVAVISDDDAMIAHAMRVLQQRLEEKQAQIEAKDAEIADKQFHLDMAHGIIEAQDEELASKDSQLRRLIPFADYARTAIECSTATYTMTDTAAFLGFVRVADFMDWCVRLGILHRLNGRWMPTAAYLGRSMFTTCVYRRMVSSYQYEENYYTVVTEAGRKALYDMMARYTDPHAAIEAECEVVEMEGGAL